MLNPAIQRINEAQIELLVAAYYDRREKHPIAGLKDLVPSLTLADYNLLDIIGTSRLFNTVKEPRMTVREVFEPSTPVVHVGDILVSPSGDTRRMVVHLLKEEILATIAVGGTPNKGSTQHRIESRKTPFRYGEPYRLTKKDLADLFLTGCTVEGRPVVETPRRKIGMGTRLRHCTIPGDFMIVCDGNEGAVLVDRNTGTWLQVLKNQSSAIHNLTKEQCEKFRIMDMTIVD